MAVEIKPGDVVRVASAYGKVLERITTETVDGKAVVYAVRLYEKGSAVSALAVKVGHDGEPVSSDAMLRRCGYVPGREELFHGHELTPLGSVDAPSLEVKVDVDTEAAARECIAKTSSEIESRDAKLRAVIQDRLKDLDRCKEKSQEWSGRADNARAHLVTDRATGVSAAPKEIKRDDIPLKFDHVVRHWNSDLSNCALVGTIGNGDLIFVIDTRSLEGAEPDVALLRCAALIAADKSRYENVVTKVTQSPGVGGFIRAEFLAARGIEPVVVRDSARMFYYHQCGLGIVFSAPDLQYVSSVQMAVSGVMNEVLKQGSREASGDAGLMKISTGKTSGWSPYEEGFEDQPVDMEPPRMPRMPSSEPVPLHENHLATAGAGDDIEKSADKDGASNFFDVLDKSKDRIGPKS